MVAARTPLALVALGLALAPAPAGAITCQDWTRLGSEQQVQRIRELIEKVASQPNPEGIEVDRGALRRCLEASVGSIDDAFDDACAEGLEAGLDALDRIFRSYVATCQG
jgi:hypothetical protein